nr:RecName: Full=Venom peptide La1 [Liocheles australasiae]
FGESCIAGRFIVPLGQQVTDQRDCALYKCVNYNKKFALETKRCATVNLKSGCKTVPGGAGAAFPSCCPMVTCK